MVKYGTPYVAKPFNPLGTYVWTILRTLVICQLFGWLQTQRSSKRWGGISVSSSQITHLKVSPHPTVISHLKEAARLQGTVQVSPLALKPLHPRQHLSHYPLPGMSTELTVCAVFGFNICNVSHTKFIEIKQVSPHAASFSLCVSLSLFISLNSLLSSAYRFSSTWKAETDISKGPQWPSLGQVKARSPSGSPMWLQGVQTANNCCLPGCKSQGAGSEEAERLVS